MSKFQIERHGDVYKMAHPEVEPVIICPECGEVAKYSHTEGRYLEDKWYGCYSFDREIYDCEHCGCRFSRRKKGSFELEFDGEGIGKIAIIISLIFTPIFAVIALGVGSVLFEVLASIAFILLLVGAVFYLLG